MPLVQEIKDTKEYVIQTIYNTRTWFEGLTARIRGDRAVVESLETPVHDEEEDVDFLKELTQAKQQELRYNGAPRRAGGNDEDDE